MKQFLPRFVQVYILLIIMAPALYPLHGYSAGTFFKRLVIVPQAPRNKSLEHAQLTAEKLATLQSNSSHLWQKAGWWNNANIMEAWIEYNRLTGKNCTKSLNDIYNKNVNRNKGNFITANSFDDNAWWALAWLKAYDMTEDDRYLATADAIFKDIVTRSWDTICGGGVRWAYGGAYKNAITNELFMQLAAKLALETADTVKKAYYVNWALKEWQWFSSSGMINKAFIINDGLNHACLNNNGITWTYNQGVILGALSDIYLLTSEHAYLQAAKDLAFASMKSLSSNNILTEPEGPEGGNDKNQFKGIYIRYLAKLNKVLHDATIKAFIAINANYAWQHARNADGFFDFNWSGPYVEWSGSAQGSALDLMNADLMQQ